MQWIKIGVYSMLCKYKLRLTFMALRRPIMKCMCDVWDLYLVRHVAQLDMVQTQVVQFISQLRNTRTIKVELLGVKLWREGFTLQDFKTYAVRPKQSRPYLLYLYLESNRVFC